MKILNSLVVGRNTGRNNNSEITSPHHKLQRWAMYSTISPMLLSLSVRVEHGPTQDRFFVYVPCTPYGYSFENPQARRRTTRSCGQLFRAHSWVSWSTGRSRSDVDTQPQFTSHASIPPSCDLVGNDTIPSCKMFVCIVKFGCGQQAVAG